MNEQTLSDEFEAAVAGEPPLGFDPGAVVDRAKAGVRRRRALTASGGGVVLVAVVAALVAGTTTAGGGAGPVSVAAAPTATTTPAPPVQATPGAVVTGEVSWPAPGTPGTTLDVTGAGRLQARARAYLDTRIPAVVDGVVDTVMAPDNGHAGEFAEGTAVGEPAAPVQVGFSVGAYAHTATTVASLGVAVKAYRAPVPSIRLDQECAKHATDPARGGALTCTLRGTSDGGHLLTAEVTIAHKPGLAAPGRYQAYTIAQYFRPDGVEVSAEAMTLPDAPASDVLLTTDQLVELVLDPHWSV